MKLHTYLDRFAYCPVCGKAEFKPNSEKSLLCGGCGFELFMNPAAATVAVIYDDEGRLLVVRRRRNPAKGTLDLPGGFCDVGETAEEGVCREVLEETGLKVCSPKFIFSLPNRYRYSGLDIPTTDLFFECQLATKKKKAVANDDAAECMWLYPDEVNPADFGLQSIRKGVKRLLTINNALQMLFRF